MAEQNSPLTQFEIKRLIPLEVGGYDVSFTNSALFMVMAVTTVTLFLTLGMRGRAMVPNRWQSMAEMAYEFVANLVSENVGSKGRAYFPFVFSIFAFVLAGNVLGMLPYSFTTTSHIAVTFGLAIIVFLLVTVLALARHGLHFFSYFMPKGVPIWLAPLIVPVEVLSYLARPVTLSMRLFANMMAGHTMMKVFAGFVLSLGFIGGWLPLGFIVALTGLEFLIAFLQAYVFAILTCLYLHDAIHLEH